MKMRKVVAALLAVLMLCSIIPFSAAAESNSATIDFTDKANRVSYSTEQQVWAQNGVTVTNDKAASTTPVGDYGGEGNPARFYASSALTVEYPGMTQIDFHCDDYKETYVTALQSSITEGSVSVDGTVVTVVLAAPVDSFVIAKLSAQVRVDSITVYGEGGGAVVPPVEPEEPETPDVPETPDEPETPASSATIDFTDKLNRTFYSSEQQVWKQNGIIVTNDKGASTSNVGDYGGEGYPARFYKSSTVKIEYFGMTKIVIDCGDLEAKYVDGWTNSFSADATASKDGNIITIELAAAADAFVWETLSAQSRAFSITVYGEGGVVEPDVPVDPEPDVPVDPEPDEPDMPGVPGETAVLDLTDKANRTSYSSSQQVWKQNGITVTNDKGASTTNVGDYGNPGRFYKNSTVTIEYPGMTKIVIDSVTYADNDYAIGWTNSFSADATATVVDGDVTIVLAEPADTFVWEQLTAQSRAYTITVYTGDDGTTPEVPPVEDPEADTELSILDAIALGASKEHNTYTEGKYYVTGVITEVYNTQYGNMKLTDEAGNILTIYGTWSEDGTIRYDALENAPVAGDTVTIYGIIGQYNGTPQIKNGWIIGFEGGDVPVDPPVSDELDLIVNPVVGTAYKFGMIQENVSATDVYYLIGGMNGFYMATGKDAAAALDVYLEKAPGGYYLYAMVNGVKQYINMVLSSDGAHVNGAYESTASTVYTYDADYKTIMADINDARYWFGTRNDKNYTTVGPCNVEYAGFYCQFYGEAGDTPVDPPVDPDPDVPVDPDDDLIDTTVPYLFGMVQENVSAEDVYFLDGGMNSYYMTTTTDENAAILVYLEKTNGGYYLYTMDGSSKKYINMVVSGTHVNGVYEAVASTVYNYDWDLYTLVSEVNGDIYAFGTRNDKTYTTMGPVKVSYGGFHADLYWIEDEPIDPCEHEYDDEYDADCNLCGEIREVPDKPIETDADLVVGNVTGSAGSTIKVPVTVVNNPGIQSAKVKVIFDTSVLKFVSYEAGNFSASGYSWSDKEVANEKGYVIINWCDAVNPDSTADLLATLTFEILADAAEGTYPMTIEFSCEDDMFNEADETVWFNAVNGVVTVVNSIPGDANGDGKVNNKDLGLLQQYLNEWPVTVDTVAIDLNGDGKVNNKDLGLLQQLLNN